MPPAAAPSPVPSPSAAAAPTATSFPKSEIKVLLLEGIADSARELLEAQGFAVETLPKALGETDLIPRLKDIHLLGIRSKTQVTPRAIESARRLLSIGCFCIGTNQVALRAANNRGMPVFNAPIDSTFRVHRPAWTARSFVAVPLGALAAVLLIVIGYRVSSASMPASSKRPMPAAAALSAQPITAPVLAPDTYVPPVADGIASFETPAAAEPTLAPAACDVRSPSARRISRNVSVSASSVSATFRSRP